MTLYLQKLENAPHSGEACFFFGQYSCASFLLFASPLLSSMIFIFSGLSRSSIHSGKNAVKSCGFTGQNSLLHEIHCERWTFVPCISPKNSGSSQTVQLLFRKTAISNSKNDRGEFTARNFNFKRFRF